jgi:hypothetical protein
MGDTEAKYPKPEAGFIFKSSKYFFGVGHNSLVLRRCYEMPFFWILVDYPILSLRLRPNPSLKILIKVDNLISLALFSILEM